MQGRKMAPWISISQHCCRFIEALLLHGETRPLTCLPARATSAASDRRGRPAVDEANRSLWPNSEFHEESLPAMPVLFFSRVQNHHNTTRVRLAMGNSPKAFLRSNSVRKRTEESTHEQQGQPP
jgi:hypothetical protein